MSEYGECPKCGSPLVRVVQVPALDAQHDGRMLVCSKCNYKRRSSADELKRLVLNKGKRVNILTMMRASPHPDQMRRRMVQNNRSTGLNFGRGCFLLNTASC